MRGSTPAKPLQSTIEREQQAEINIIDANGKGATITFINTIASQPRLDPQPSPSSIARSIIAEAEIYFVISNQVVRPTVVVDETIDSS